MFMRRKPFTKESIRELRDKHPGIRIPGVYIIYLRANDRAAYVGRSSVDVIERLRRHVNCDGNIRIADAIRRGVEMTFEYQEMMSMEQAEAQLIVALGTREVFNLRLESDPADWETSSAGPAA